MVPAAILLSGLGASRLTGAGKSSLLLSLLRVLGCQQGMIAIDGRDIASLPLRQLRSSLAVIPQDPIQVAANVRLAVDPFSQHSDTECLAILREVGLTGLHAGTSLHLQTDLKEGGINLSVGQRQLLCLARALLAKVATSAACSLFYGGVWPHAGVMCRGRRKR